MGAGGQDTSMGEYSRKQNQMQDIHCWMFYYAYSLCCSNKNLLRLLSQITGMMVYCVFLSAYIMMAIVPLSRNDCPSVQYFAYCPSVLFCLLSLCSILPVVPLFYFACCPSVLFCLLSLCLGWCSILPIVPLFYFACCPSVLFLPIVPLFHFAYFPLSRNDFPYCPSVWNDFPYYPSV
jgi:hypothetical protein